MRRSLGAAVVPLTLGAAGGCDRRKDEAPTQIEPLPKEQPQPVANVSPD